MRSPSPSLTLLFLSSLAATVYAGTAKTGEPCNQGNNRLQTGSFQFWSECTATNFCSDQGFCQAKGCRRDDFPFGYAQDSNMIPDKCPRGQFCPDEGTSCQPLLPVGSPCQMNRDDECEAPPNFRELADTTGRGINFNGSVCLNNVCMWANVTLGNACIVENTAYIAYEVGGEFINIVSRGNCAPGLFCDSAQKVCMNEKSLGDSCTADKECQSWNCLASGVCGVAAAEPRHFGIYVYILVALGIFGGMFVTLIGLFFLHRKQRDVEREKRLQYWREQNAFHQNLMQMREAARMSILSLSHDRSARSTIYDDSAPMLPNAAPTAKSSGLRHYVGDDGSSENDDAVMMQPSKKAQDNNGSRF